MADQGQGLRNRYRLLWALTRYPGWKLKDIAYMLGMRPSTTSILKKDIIRRGWMSRVYIPLVQRLGCEILGVVYADFNPTIPPTKRSEVTRKAIEIYDELFYSIGDARFGFSLNFARDYTSMLRINEKRIEIFTSNNFIDKKLPSLVMFSFHLSKLYRFFDTAPLLAHSLGLEEVSDMEVEEENVRMFSNTLPPELSEMEKRILVMMVDGAEITPKEVASNLNVSERYVHTVKKRLNEQEIYKEVVIPNFWSIGFNILHVLHGRFNPSTLPEESLIKKVFLSRPQIIFFIKGRYEFFSMAVYRNFDEFKEAEGRLLKDLNRQDMISEICASYTFNYDSMVIMKDLSFGPIIRNLLKA